MVIKKSNTLYTNELSFSIVLAKKCGVYCIISEITIICWSEGIDVIDVMSMCLSCTYCMRVIIWRTTVLSKGQFYSAFSFREVK